MSLFGALFTAVSGMSAESQATAMISNNIANVDTIGFKGNNAAFYSLVTTNAVGGQYNPGTVQVNTVQNITQEGSIQQTSSSTDAAISGNGFFTVKQSADADQPFLYTRSGSFSEDATGQLINTAGDVLYAWPLSSSGALPSNSGDLSSLVPANVAFLGGLTKPTTDASLSINFDSSEVDNNPALAATPSVLPLDPATTPADFTRGLTVYDSLGSPQNLTIQMRKIVGPMASASGATQNLSLTTSLTDPAVFPKISAGDQFSVSVNTSPAPTTQQYIVGAPGSAGPPSVIRVDTVGDLINQMNSASGLGGGTAVDATLDQSGRLLLQADNPTLSLTLTNITGTPLGTFGSPASDTGTLNFAGQPGLGSAQASTSYSATLTGATVLTTVPGIVAQNQISVTNGTITKTYDIGAANGTAGTGTGSPVSTVANLISGINTDFPGTLTAALTGGQLVITATSPARVTVADTDANGAGTPIEALGFSGTSTSMAFTPQAPITPTGTPPTYPPGSTYAGQGDFPALANTTSPNTQGWWEMTVEKPDGTTLSQGLLNFTTNGTLNASADANGTIGVNLKNINWNNGSSLSNIDVDVSKFTQFAGQYNVVSTDQNGAALGLRTGVEITKDGLVVAQFSNGATANLYQIPMSTFADPNALQAESGTAYSETAGSGTNNLRVAGTGGAGFLQPSALEGSNVDLADEFAKLIVSQRAYTANTRVVNTVDDMTQDLLRLV